MEGKLFEHRCRWVGGCGSGFVWHFFSVASTFVVKWEAKLSAESEEGEENKEDWREKEVYDTHLNSYKNELIREMWYNCLGY